QLWLERQQRSDRRHCVECRRCGRGIPSDRRACERCHYLVALVSRTLSCGLLLWNPSLLPSGFLAAMATVPLAGGCVAALAATPSVRARHRSNCLGTESGVFNPAAVFRLRW